MTARSMISFDWAMKRLLRNKANFEVLEGFLSELLRRKIIVKSIAESESNKARENEKGTRLDMLVEADGKELVIVELQYFGEAEYFHRMLYGVSRVVTEHLKAGEKYSNVRKVYSISIVYFDLGEGDDYIYHGFTDFKGLHTQTSLQLNPNQRTLYDKMFPGDLYPEYYIIKLGKFNDVAKNTLDEWVYYLKNYKIEADFTAQGLDKAREILAYDNLSEQDKAKYRHDMDMRLLSDSEITTARQEGELKGEAIGLEKGEAIGELKKALAIAAKLLKKGTPLEEVAELTGLTMDEINIIVGNRQGAC